MKTAGFAVACCLIGALPVTAVAQDRPPAANCSADAHRQFDFYAGEWRIVQRISDGAGDWLEFPGRTSVAPAIDGCALVEHWEGDVQFFWAGMSEPEPLKGLSVRAYNPGSDEWRIWWMDNRSPVFGSGFAGGFEGNRGEFFSEPRNGSISRITFVNESAGVVDWNLAMSRDDGETWTIIWTMHMTRI